MPDVNLFRVGEERDVSSVRIVITMPAYKAEATLARTVADIPPGIADQLILVDDASPDNTAALARELGIDVHVHPQNRGYGGNQKTCYTMALHDGADIVVMLHPDYQYEPKAVPLLIAPIVAGDADMTFGSRFAGLGDPLRGGMPVARYVGNRTTTIVENLLLGSRFSEMHSGMRAYSRSCLLSQPFLRYRDDFVFDSQFLIDAVTRGQRVVEVPIPTRYTEESSSIGISSSLTYVLESLGYCARTVWSHGRKRYRSPIGRRPAQSNGRAVPHAALAVLESYFLHQRRLLAPPEAPIRDSDFSAGWELVKHAPRSGDDGSGLATAVLAPTEDALESLGGLEGVRTRIAREGLLLVPASSSRRDVSERAEELLALGFRVLEWTQTRDTTPRTALAVARLAYDAPART
jgi:glycosyltransferase involved in cell wall biosynthesis